MSVHYGHKDVLEYFETPEGTYNLKSILSPKCLPGIAPSVRLSSVRLSFCDSRSVCCINSGRDICIYPISGCRLYDSHSTGKQTFKTSTPVCHDFGVSSLLLVGFFAGEIHMIDPFHKELCKVFNEDKYIDRTPVTCIQWVPYSTNQFLVSNASGHLYLYNEELPCCPTPPVYQQLKKGFGYVVYTCKTKSSCNPLYNWALTNVPIDSIQSKMFEDCDVSTVPLSSINQFSFSTCGKYLAVVTEDGYLRVFDYHRMQLYGFMRSYFGGLTCVDWSPDGKYVVVGGQDDLITIWSFNAQAVICRGRGHKSWTSVVRFDPFVYPPSLCNGTTMMRDLGTGSDSLSSNKGSHQHHCSLALDGESTFRTYRLGSVGQDTFLCLWELTEDVIRQSLRFTSQYHRSIGSGLHHSGGLSTSSASTFTSTCAESMIDGSENGRAVPCSSGSGSGKRKPFLSSFRSPLSLPSRHSELSDASGKSVLSDGLCFPLLGDKRPMDGINQNNFPVIFSKDLLGTPNCPRLSDVPILEPFAKFGITSDLITDLVFREDSINLAFQQGVILSYTRPQIEAYSMASAVAGDLSIFDAPSLVGHGDAVGAYEDGMELRCVEAVNIGVDADDDGDVTSPIRVRASIPRTTTTTSTNIDSHHRRQRTLSAGLQHRLSEYPFVPELTGQAL